LIYVVIEKRRRIKRKLKKIRYEIFIGPPYGTCVVLIAKVLSIVRLFKYYVDKYRNAVQFSVNGDLARRKDDF
jgi:hypothetical protein